MPVLRLAEIVVATVRHWFAQLPVHRESVSNMNSIITGHQCEWASSASARALGAVPDDEALAAPLILPMVTH